MQIILNGEPYQLERPLMVVELLAQLELEPEKVAIERNLAIVPSSLFGTTRILEHDTLEIVHFIGGG